MAMPSAQNSHEVKLKGLPMAARLEGEFKRDLDAHFRRSHSIRMLSNRTSTNAARMSALHKQ